MKKNKNLKVKVCFCGQAYCLMQVIQVLYSFSILSLKGDEGDGLVKVDPVDLAIGVLKKGGGWLLIGLDGHLTASHMERLRTRSGSVLHYLGCY